MYDLGPAFARVTVPAGTSLLVSGPPLEGVRANALAPLTYGGRAGDSVLVVSMRYGGESILSELEGAVDGAPLRVVDCVSQQQGRTLDDERVRHARSPADLTGIGIEFSAALEALDGQTRVLFDSLTMLKQYAAAGAIAGFVRGFTDRIEETDALALATVERPALDDADFRALEELFDATAHVESGSVVETTL